MLEIESDNRRITKDMGLMFTASLGILALLYFLLVMIGADIFAFYAISSLLLIMIVPFAIFGFMKQKIVIDTDEKKVRNYLGKRKVSGFGFEKIQKLEYKVTKKGYTFLTVTKKDGLIFSIASWLYREYDIKRAFDELSSFSEEYGFEVKQTMDYADGVPSGSFEVSGNDDAPYKIR